ncbi:response regulator [Dokdonia sp. Asnod2-E02]|uniref:response regulator n=1 Tax=Dokdonia sp. Asnod2-E02 TaxID=3160574 RepID=UPI00386FC619
MKNKLLIIIIICCYGGLVYCQTGNNKVVDSVTVLLSLSKDENISGNYKEGLQYATSAVQYANQYKDKSLQAKAYVSLANTYQAIKDYAEAKKYYNLALDKNTDDYFVNVASLNGLGNIYSMDIATADKAAAFFERSIDYTLEAGNTEHSFYTYYNIAGMYLNFKDPDKAYPYILEANKLLPTIQEEDPIYVLLQQLNFAIYYNQKENHTLALTYIDKALEIGEEHTLTRELIDIYDFKSEIHQERGEYDLALASLKKHFYYKDLDFNEVKTLQIEQVEADFKVKEFQQKAEASQLKSNFIAILGVGILLFLSTCFLVFYNYKRRLSFTQLEKKNDALLQAKNEAEHANQIKSELLVNISHDLRTPLYGVVGITEMLMENPSIIKTKKGLLNSLKFSGDHLKSVVNNILKINEVESNKITVNQSKVNIKTLLENVVNSLKYLADQQETQLILDIKEEVYTYYMLDEVNLSDVLLKLIDNAIKNTQKGTVTLSVSLSKREKSKDHVTFKISDTGTGISKENLAVIFDSFKQGNSEENTAYGIGLGLPIVKSLIEVMGSKLTVVSDIGLGSQFSFTLECEITNEDNQLDDISIHKSLHILIVEDNKINQLVTQKLISSLGHSCTITVNGEEAIKECNNTHFDLILMDLNMPVMNGFEASEVISTENKNIPIIALTALEISEVKERCHNVGICAIVNKPVDKEALEDIIRKNLSFVKST